MNKKIATLGLAAVLGLAGVVALPVLAATTFEKDHLKKVTPELETKSEGEGVAKKFYTVKNVDLTGLVKVDGTVFGADDFTNLVNMINGKAAAELKKFPVDTNGNGVLEGGETEAAATALAVADATDSAITAHETVVFEGTMANIVKALGEIATEVVAHPDGDLDKAVAKVKTLKLMSTDAAPEISATNAEALNKFAKLAKSAQIELSFNKYATTIVLSGFTVTPEYKNLRMVTTPIFEKATANAMTEANFLAAAKILGVKYDKAELSAVPGMDPAEKLKLGANYTPSSSNDNTNQGDKTEDKAGDKNNKPEGGIKAPDTGIAE